MTASGTQSPDIWDSRGDGRGSAVGAHVAQDREVTPRTLLQVLCGRQGPPPGGGRRTLTSRADQYHQDKLIRSTIQFPPGREQNWMSPRLHQSFTGSRPSSFTQG